MLFNDLLAQQNIDPASVLVLRHTPRAEDGRLRKVLPWLAADHPDIFNAYQSTQTQSVEAKMLRANYVASFIGSDGNAAVFIGLYKVAGHRPMTFEQFWSMSAYQEMKKYGMRGFVKGDRPSVEWFDLTLTDFYTHWKGKLMVRWPSPPIAWSRFADKAEFPIIAILKDSWLLPEMPEWRDCVWPWDELHRLPSSWRDTLRQWRGVYFIFDQSDGKGYVGATYGNDNILGRWENYATTGHGGNVLLRGRSPENFHFSILERVSLDIEDRDLMALESAWKKRLHTRSPSGLNDN